MKKRLQDKYKVTKRLSLLAILTLAAAVAPAQSTLTNVTDAVASGLVPVEYSSVAWGDYDNDGRLDFLITGLSVITTVYPYGLTHTSTNYAHLWRNTGSGFSNVTATVAPGLKAGPVTWVDYDGDGWLDFMISGQLWRNTGTGFINVTTNVGLAGMIGGTVAWGDYDNDGRMDLICAGYSASQIWRNTGNGFSNVTDIVAPGLPNGDHTSVAWGDYDNDGRLDLLIAGTTGPVCEECDIPDAFTQIWRNTGSGFENVTVSVAPGLPGAGGTVAWGDYDNDGRLDFFVSGYAPGVDSISFFQLWRNTGNGFVNVTPTVAAGMTGDIFGTAAWGDYDNDGRLDILFTALSYFPSYGSQLWRNTANGFTNVTDTVAPGLPRISYSSLAWGDYDNDGRLDLVIAGSLYSHCDGCDQYGAVSQIWHNTTPVAHPPPVAMTRVPTGGSHNGVTLNGSVNPHGQVAAGWFIWGNSTNYGGATTPQPIGKGNSWTNFSQAITGLSTGVTYYYRAMGSNDQGQVVVGVEQQFALALPVVTTSTTVFLTPHTATLKAHLAPNNLPTYGWFEWGLTPTLGQVTPVQFLGNGLDSTLSQDLTDVEVGSTYYFRPVVSNDLGVVYGAAQGFVEPVVCPGFISPTNRIHGYAGGTGYSITFQLECDWVVVNTNSWITITSATNGGPWGIRQTLTYDLALNPNLQARSGNITIGSHNLSVTQAPFSCDYYISPGGTGHGYGATEANIYVATGGNCPWNVVNTNSWITILSGGEGSGVGQIRYALEANKSVESRSGTIGIGWRLFYLTQEGHSVVSLPADQVVALGGTATFSVTINSNSIAAPFTIHWQFNGVDLVDGGGISGARTTSLVLTNVQYSQGGHYRCVVTNAAGAPYASSSATLTVAPTSNALSIAEAADTGDMFFWKTWSNSRGIWFGQTNTTYDGFDALECSGITSGQFASLETKSGGPGILSFWWKSAFASPSVGLFFWIGGSQSASLTTTTDWEQKTFVVPPGDVDLRWTLSNSGSTESKAWLDEVDFLPCDFHLSSTYNYPDASYWGTTGTVTVTAASPDCPWHVVNTNSWITILSSVTNHGSSVVTFAVAGNPTPNIRQGFLNIADQAYSIGQYPGLPTNNPVVSLAEALDTEGSLAWTTIGTPEWFGQRVMSRDGVDAAQSGPVADGGAVTAATTVNEPGTILFWWKVSSETNKDYLKFFLNGVQQTRISGETDWQFVKYDLPSVTNTLKWTYSKNLDGADGNDRGWFDQIQFIPASQTGICVRAISPTSVMHTGNSATGTVYVVTTAECAWDVVNTNSWISTDPNGGSGFVGYTLSANNSRTPRTGVLLIGGRPFTVTQRGAIPPCAYTLSSISAGYDDRASTGYVIRVTTDGDCDWSVITTNDWITITSSPANFGSGQVTYTVSQNKATVPRIGQMVIAGQTYAVWQDGAPAPTLAQALDTVGTSLQLYYGSSVGFVDNWKGQFAVTHDGVDAAQSGDVIPNGSSPFGAFSYFGTTTWVPGTLTHWWKVSAGSTNGGLRFQMDNIEQAAINNEVDWQQQTFIIPPGRHDLEWIYSDTTPSGGHGHGWVDQVQFTPAPGCAIALSSSGVPFIGTHASTNHFDVITAGNCPWIAINTNSWITILSGGNGTGSGGADYTVSITLTYAVAANPTTSARSGALQVADQAFLITQGPGSSNPPICTISISPSNRVQGYAAARNTVLVTAQPGCPWSVFASNSWISILSGANNSGSGSVLYSITANTNSLARSGSILISGQRVLLMQSGTPQSGTNSSQLQIMSQTETDSTLLVQGPEGKVYIVECSEDLVHWTPISTNISPSSITDAARSNAPKRFYRAVESH